MQKYKFDKENHLHTLDDKPLIGTSTVCSVLAKPLTWWAVGEGLKTLGWTPINRTNLDTKRKERVPKEERIANIKLYWEITRNWTPESMLESLDIAYYAHDKVKDKKAQAGTDLHAMLEKYILSGEILDDKIIPFVEWSKQNVKKWIFSEAHCFSSRLWVGGIADACCELNDGKIAVIDFKSSKEAYLNQYFQACGYALQIEENGYYTADGTLTGALSKPVDIIIIFPFGADKIEPWTYWDMEGGKKAFECMTYLYKITNI